MDAFRAVMISGNGYDLCAKFINQCSDRLVKECHGFGGRDGAVVDIACDDDQVGLLTARTIDKLREYELLLFKQREIVQVASQVPVGRVEDFHRKKKFVYSCAAKSCISAKLREFSSGGKIPEGKIFPQTQPEDVAGFVRLVTIEHDRRSQVPEIR